MSICAIYLGTDIDPTAGEVYMDKAEAFRFSVFYVKIVAFEQWGACTTQEN